MVKQFRLLSFLRFPFPANFQPRLGFVILCVGLVILAAAGML
jgi:hypothetical protein